MIIAKNDEEKRSRIWGIVTLTATIVIIVIVAFFIIKLFTANPLEGTWVAEDSDMALSIKGGSTMTAQWQNLLEENNVKVKLKYSMDKESKTMTITVDDNELKKAADKSDGQFTEQQMAAAISSLTTTFDYSVDRSQLTLTEREYGEQIILKKK